MKIWGLDRAKNESKMHLIMKYVLAEEVHKAACKPGFLEAPGLGGAWSSVQLQHSECR